MPDVPSYISIRGADAMMRVKQVAERLDVAAGTVYLLIAAGKLECVRVGRGRGAIRVTEDQFGAFVGSATSTPPPPRSVAAPRPRRAAYVPRKDHGLGS